MKISLITACYDSEATITTAIESVLSQKGVDVEYIVVDGASTDGTIAIEEEFSHKEHKEHKGVVENGGGYPCEFFGSDTSGEKTFEEFYTDTDVKDYLPNFQHIEKGKGLDSRM